MLQFELVLPCYNESKSLETLIKRAAEAAIEAGYSEKSFQLVLVQNGSKDDSSRVMDELKMGSLGKWFRKVDISVNEGYGYGIFSGLKNTTAKFVGWSHADQQCDPRDAFTCLKLLIESKNNEVTLVKGVRFGRNWKDRIISWVFSIFANLILGLKGDEINAQPKVFHRSLVSQIHQPPKNFSFDLYVLYRAQKLGFTFLTVPVLFPPRVHGFSNWAHSFIGRYKTIILMIQYMWQLMKQEGRL
jgi:glycosyltransferase involved in cell wall biosynthesis